MSWSISATGPKDQAIKSIKDQASGLSYKPGTPEGDDVVAAVGRIEALAASLVASEKIAVTAYGSHSTMDGGILSAQFSVTVANV